MLFVSITALPGPMSRKKFIERLAEIRPRKASVPDALSLSLLGLSLHTLFVDCRSQKSFLVRAVRTQTNPSIAGLGTYRIRPALSGTVYL